jgi:triosephosphate isomerase
VNRKYRKTVIAANFKMNKTPTQVKDYTTELRRILPKGRWCDIVICPATPCLPAAIRGLKETRVAVGAQNVHAAAEGAYTGEVSTAMLCDLGVRHVILGHSERRAMGETDQDVRAKVETALAAGLTPIICVGETLAQRETGITTEWVTMQLKTALSGVAPEQVRKTIIAYEPIWAIGTGKTATPEEAQEVCETIRTVIRKRFGAKIARAVSILYGGSMNDRNAYDLLAQPDIDGGLIGTAALDPETFVRIIEAANQPTE